MKLVFKKFLGVFKSKFLLVPLIAVGLVAIGAGAAAITNRDPAATSSNPQNQSDSSLFGKRGESITPDTDTLGQSVPDSSGNSSTYTAPTSNSAPTASQTKPKTSTSNKPSTPPPTEPVVEPPVCAPTDENGECDPTNPPDDQPQI